METIINNEKALDDYVKFLRAKFAKERIIRVSAVNAKARTITQNKALHKFCAMLAKELNDGGFDFRTFIKDGYPVPFNVALVKEFIWGPIQKAVTGFDSSTKPEAKQYSEIYDALNTKLIEHGLYVPWPCKDELIAKSYHE